LKILNQIAAEYSFRGYDAVGHGPIWVIDLTIVILRGRGRDSGLVAVALAVPDDDA
jgi:hypothetical protein